MVTFLDEVENVYDFTPDVQQFQAWVSEQHAHGGGDYEENSLDALLAATQLSFRPTSNRVIIWITDAAYHSSNSVTDATPVEVVNALLEQGITAHCIGNPQEQVDFYEPITIPTGGDYYNIYGNFRDILLDIARLKYITDYLIYYNSYLELNDLNSIKVEVHYGGLGGSDEIVIDIPPLTSNNFSANCYPNPFVRCRL